MMANWNCAKALTSNLADLGWKTPDTYGREFDVPERKSAVYIFILYAMDDDGLPDYGRAIVAYVGMSTRLKTRWQSHDVYADLVSSGHYVQRWFCHKKKSEIRSEELGLIRRYDPPWNIQGRARGIAL